MKHVRRTSYSQFLLATAFAAGVGLTLPQLPTLPPCVVSPTSRTFAR